MSDKQKVKKPFYKRWWFIGIVLVVVISAIAGSGDEEPTGNNQAAMEESGEASSEIEDLDDEEKVDTEETSTEPMEDSEEEPKEEEVDLTISGSELAKAFDENEVRAKSEYTGKVAEVTGKVADIGEIFGQTYIVLESFDDFAITSVQCMFEDEGEIEKIVNLNKGDEVTIVGTIGEKSMNVAVEDCVIK